MRMLDRAFGSYFQIELWEGLKGLSKHKLTESFDQKP